MTIEQSGYQSSAAVNLGGDASYNEANIVQSGGFNQAGIHQYFSRHNLASIQQNGSGLRASIGQSGGGKQATIARVIEIRCAMALKAGRSRLFHVPRLDGCY